MEQAEKKGMSKGCLVGLIIGGAVIVILVVGTLTCWYYKDDLVKMGVSKSVYDVKNAVAANPPETIDTAQFNALADAFLEKFDADDSLELEKYGAFIQSLQLAHSDSLTAEIVAQVSAAMIEYYPELADLYRIETQADSLMMPDSALSQ